MQAYNSLLATAPGVAATPYTPYSSTTGQNVATTFGATPNQLVAPVNQQQNLGISGINQYAQSGIPYIQQAAGQAASASQPITAGQIQNYTNPYTSAVVNATQNQFNNQNAIQQNGIVGNAAAQGALGGNRVGVAQGIAAGQQQLAQAPVIAGLESQGYQQGVSTALAEQQAGLAGAYGVGSLGTALQNAGLTGANAQIGAGTLQQQTQQATDTAAYQQFLNQQAYPFQTEQWLAGLETGVGSQMGGTSQTVGPPPNPLNAIIGAGGALGAAAISDRRLKKNIQKIGKLFDGQTIYKFTYGDDPTTHIGLMAQDVEKRNPNAVHEMQGIKLVNYDEATKDAERKWRGGTVGLATGGTPYDGGNVGISGTPYAGSNSYVPSMSITMGKGPPAPPQIPGQPAYQIPSSYGAMAKALGQSNAGVAGQPIALDGSVTPDVSGYVDTSGFASPEAAGLGVSGLYRKGGRVRGYDDGGGVNPGFNDPNYFPPEDATGGIMGRLPTYASAGDLSGYAPAANGVVPTPTTGGGRFAGLSKDGTPIFDNSDINLDLGTGDPNGKPAPYVPNQEQNAVVANLNRGQSGVAGDTYPLGGSQERPVTDTSGAPASAPTALRYNDDNKGISRPPADIPPQHTSTDTANVQTAVAKPEDKNKGFGLGYLPKDVQMALISGFAGMMASRSPFLGVGIGEGVQHGVATYGAEQKQAMDSRRIDLEAQRLSQEADRAAKELALKTETEHQGTWAQQQQAALAKQQYERELTKPVNVPIGGTLVNPRTGEVIARGGGSNLSQDAIEVGARQLANGDMSPLTNVGRGAQGDAKLTALRNRAAQILIVEGGMTPQEAATHLSNQVQEFRARQTGLSAGARTAATRGTNLDMIIDSAEAAAPAAIEASRNVARTGWVPINNIIQAGRVIASDPAQKEFGMANLQLAEHWARAMNPTGVMRESDRDKALSFLNTADSQPTYERAVNQLLKQIHRERDAVKKSEAKSTTAVPGGEAPSETAGATATGANAPTTPASPPTITSKADYDKLAPKSQFLDANGKLWTKP